jgi:spermidine synthase
VPPLPLLMLFVFALTLFGSATLLFFIEPMVGKMLLPLLGGTPAVWNTCMVFFQAVLLAGYGYAHAATAWLGARKQALLHLVVLLIPFFFFPLAVNRELIASGAANPIPALLLVLTLSVGVPMFVVCASAPLLQKWFASTNHPAARDPYFLYGASNLGSMLALVAYPALVEPNLRLDQQRILWAVGFGLLALATAACAWFLWRSPVPVTDKSLDAPAESPASSTAVHASKERFSGRPASRKGKSGPNLPEQPSVATLPDTTLGGDVTAWRVLRWIALAFVPSSLMLGVTTYITTDIAAIPLLWVLPLALYLLSFILVFSSLPVQRVAFWVLLVGLVGAVVFLVAPWAAEMMSTARSAAVVKVVVRLSALAALAAFPFRKVPDLLHKFMVLAMPLLVLLLVFLMQTGSKVGGVEYRIALHLLVLFVVAMVCHGELARDRPPTRYLTSYYLWMSLGGVLGGLFNGLVAPLVFNALVEYQLALVLACLLLPALSVLAESSWGRTADLCLGGLFVGVGVLLLVLRYRDHDLHYEHLRSEFWGWEVVGLILLLAVGVAAALRGKGERPADRWLDLALPLCLAVLVVGLRWGLYADVVWPRVRAAAKMVNLEPAHFVEVLAFGIPAVMCYTFVERSLRFGLGLGALLLAGIFAGSVHDKGLLFQKRSFFGVLQVKEGTEQWGDTVYHYRTLVHGTTLHGQQFTDNEAVRQEPLTYYHRTGPIGQLFGAYNTDPSRNVAIIGLGTGTMACYALPGQHFTFYDIDPVVRDISFREEGAYFTFVNDARRRGAKLDLILGDARVTMERNQLADADRYSLMVIDAFSSDAIPIHLITREALQLYLSRLTEDGIVAFHVSNRYLRLNPVLANMAEESGLAILYESDDRDEWPGKSSSTWVVLARKPEYLSRLIRTEPWEAEQKEIESALLPLTVLPSPTPGIASQAWMLHGIAGSIRGRWDVPKTEPRVGIWTDDYSNLLSVFSWSVVGP